MDTYPHQATRGKGGKGWEHCPQSQAGAVGAWAPLMGPSARLEWTLRPRAGMHPTVLMPETCEHWSMSTTHVDDVG